MLDCLGGGTMKDIRARSLWLLAGYGVGLLVALAMLASCATVPPPAPTPCPTPDCDAYTVACANLAHIGCADGLAASCPAVLRELATGEPLAPGPLTHTDVPCLTAAQTVGDAVACGGVSCN